ncbi:hypothetical protein [Clostridium sp.]|jgi:hypothetical protein|uniref:hypothetical protein n=1 Tax=Clostridium sp. TaxID=1506 RepID=UPI002FCA8C0D
MKEQNLKLAQKDIDDALLTIEELEKSLKENSISDNIIKENFLELSRKMQEIEDILKEEGIL